MKNIRKETVEREIYESESGFEYIEESTSHSLYEEKENGCGCEGEKLEETGAGATGDRKLVTPDGEELTNLKEVFNWLDENQHHFRGGDPNVGLDESTLRENIQRAQKKRRDTMNKTGRF